MESFGTFDGALSIEAANSRRRLRAKGCRKEK